MAKKMWIIGSITLGALMIGTFLLQIVC